MGTKVILQRFREFWRLKGYMKKKEGNKDNATMDKEENYAPEKILENTFRNTSLMI